MILPKATVPKSPSAVSPSLLADARNLAVSKSFMLREVERLNEEVVDLQRHNASLHAENQKLRKEITSEGDLKESYYQV